MNDFQKNIRYFGALIALTVFSSVFGNYTYREAVRLQSNGRMEAALEAFVRAADQARRSEDEMGEFGSYYSASYAANSLSKNRESIEYAKSALAILDANSSEKWAQKETAVLNKVEMMGLIERGNFCLARLGEGWKAHRMGVDFLRQKLGIQGTGHLKPEEVLRFPSRFRAQGFRYIEREAEYLHETGNTTLARELMEAAMEASSEYSDSKDRARTLYSRKLIGNLGVIEGFVGNELRSIELSEKEYFYAQRDSSRADLIRIRLNILSSIVDYRGADEKIIEEANSLLAEAERLKIKGLGASKRMHARIL